MRQLLDPHRQSGKAEDLERKLRLQIVGQEQAIQKIISAYGSHVTGLSPAGRPIANFLFLGPTGSGKTRVVEVTAEALLQDSNAVVKIDCAEYQHSHEIAKLVGSPPGYLGHRETHPLLSQETLNQHHTETVKLSIVLFDEIEKASDALWNLLLGILDKATLTLGDNRKVDFSSAMIFMTSNLGAGEMNKLLGDGIGFTIKQKIQAHRLDETGTAAARRCFTPEFINRVDNIVSFQPLGDAELRRVLDIEIEKVRERIKLAASENFFDFDVKKDALDFLLVQGTDARYGARHLKRAIERELVQPLSNLIATGQARRGDLIGVDITEGDDHLAFFREDWSPNCVEIERTNKKKVEFPEEIGPSALSAEVPVRGATRRART